ncbi:hypothetical protein POPTR_003G026712v4 [Populus trichocarpa]|uniref:Uncharacterized protein n=1 Tax=Populus trichocarpa TaxID=3694 RepID=A0ACC0T6X4_POPTR|nr:hypothetical protein POPTR_003G026712v4 [Populus trichocarpa]
MITVEYILQCEIRDSPGLQLIHLYILEHSHK